MQYKGGKALLGLPPFFLIHALVMGIFNPHGYIFSFIRIEYLRSFIDWLASHHICRINCILLHLLTFDCTLFLILKTAVMPSVLTILGSKTEQAQAKH